MKTSELSGAALDWAVAKCEGQVFEVIDGGLDYDCPDYSSYWAQGGPIIERERIAIRGWEGDEWIADVRSGFCEQFGPTPLIAAMRCYVASKLGDEIQLPEELTNG